MTVSFFSLIVQETKAQLYESAISLCDSLGLPVTSWQAGDPTRSLFHFEAETLSKLEEVAVGYCKSAFLEYAPAGWRKIIAKQFYNIDVPDPTFATTDVVLTNAGGGEYTDDDTAAGALSFRNTTSGKTYHNTTGGTLSPLGTLTVSIIADEAGSDSNAAAGEIELVTALLGVTASNASAALASDEWPKETTIAQCHDKIDMMSPDGMPGAYRYVARNSELTGVDVVTDARAYGSDTGEVTIYVRSASGPVAAPDVALVQEAILQWATPLCVSPTTVSAAAVVVPVSYQLWAYASVNRTSAELDVEVEEALETMFSERPIGGDVIPPAAGALYHSLIESTIRGLYPDIFRVEVTTPSGDTTLTEGQVVTLGAVTPTINFVEKRS
jgi:hypothetical protein